MTTEIFQFSKPDLFCAAARFVTKEKIRPYLAGVYVEPAAAGGAYLVSTDGHRMLVGYDAGATAPRAVLIQPPRIKMPAAWWKFTGMAWAQDTLYGSPQSLEGAKEPAQFASDFERAPELRGCVFPDWARILPDMTQEIELAHFNGDYIADFFAVRKHLCKMKGGGALPIRHHGIGAAYVQLRDDAFGVLMPCRVHKGVDDGLPFEIRRADA